MENITDDEIRLIGRKPTMTPKKKRTLILIGVIVAIALLLVILLMLLRQNEKTEEIVKTAATQTGSQQNADEPQNSVLEADITRSTTADSATFSIDISDTVVDGIKLRRFMPGNVVAELAKYDSTLVNDSSVVFLTQAANIRGNDFKIIGDFVLKGDALESVTTTVKGFCAILGRDVILGKDDTATTIYLDSAKIKKGYFFRQTTYVKGGEPMTFGNEAKSFRRAICSLNKKSNQLLVIESLDKVTMQEFANALSNHQVVNAVGLIGSFILDEWYRKPDGERVQLFTNNNSPNPNRNYLIFRKK